MNPKHAKQLASMPEKAIPRGDTYEQRRYLKSQARVREAAMRQFCKTDGPAGNSEAYVDGWERIWGRKS